MIIIYQHDDDDHDGVDYFYYYYYSHQDFHFIFILYRYFLLYEFEILVFISKYIKKNVFILMMMMTIQSMYVELFSISIQWLMIVWW